ncbi:hypothetical protein [Janthinobacterium sp. RB2R34]|uniref:hypothetical protein n=1 Tax=Janthinobacterium sp. RB2R34 TaxID=3424193 RepID=UPI003F1F20BE
MAEISLATQEQSSGIDQINQAISQMDQVTQQNAALVEEAAAAAESLQEQAGKLSEVVSVFRLDGVQVQAPAAPRKAATPKRPAIRAANHSTAPRAALKAAPATGYGKPANDDWEEF